MKSPFTFLQGIIIAIVLPIILLLVFVIYSRDNSLKLVERDYYQKEIEYQTQINRETRSNQLSQKIIILNESNDVLIQFPSNFLSEEIYGTITFFRPSDSRLDFSEQIDLDIEGIQKISTTDIKNGAWIVKVLWNNQQDDYYSEKRIFVNH